MTHYSQTNRNKIHRVPRRGHYDQKTVHDILDDGFLCHVSFCIEGQPYIIPTLYGRKGETIFIHGASTSRLIKNLEKGIPVSLAVTHLDGLVLARSAFHHSANYRSVVIFGTAHPVKDDEAEDALQLISEHIIPGRWQEVRQPNRKELKATNVLAIQIEDASAKIREGGPVDDEEDYQLDIWAGQIPLNLMASPAINDPVLSENTSNSAAAEKFIAGNILHSNCNEPKS